MTSKLNKINEIVLKICQLLSVILIFLIIISTSVQVITRFLLNSSLVGTEEVSRYSFIWASMLGAGICVSRHSHANVSFLSDILKGKFKLLQEVFVQIMIGIMGVLLIVQGYKMVQITLNQLSPTLKVPMWIIYLAIPIGGIIILFGSICNMLNILSKVKHGGEEE